MTLRNKIEIPLACLSLANLFFMPAWVDLSIVDLNFMPNIDVRLYSLATIIEVLTLGTGLYLCYFLLNRLAVWPWVLRFLFFMSLVFAIPAIIALYHLLPDLRFNNPFITRVLALGLILVLAAAILRCLYFRREMVKAAGNIGKVCLLLMAPLLIVSGYSLGKGLLFPYTLADRLPIKSFLGQDQARRVVLFIFDELDNKWAVENRPSSVAMPIFDVFRNVSWEAVEAYPPGNATIRSIPSYLLGNIVSETRLNDPFNMDVLIEGTQSWLPANNPENLLGRLNKMRVSSGIIGFAIPYGRIYGSQLVMCRWEAGLFNSFGLPNALLWAFPIIKSYPFARRLALMQTKNRLLRNARQAMGRKDIGFLLIHLPYPHLPTQYDPQTGRRSYFIVDRNPFRSYKSNLIRMDQVLESLLDSLNASGAAANTTVILTSDHWFRDDPSPGFRIPFIVHFPGQTNKVLFNESFNTVTLCNLIPEIFSGTITNGEQLSIWMQANAFRKKVNYTKLTNQWKNE